MAPSRKTRLVRLLRLLQVLQAGRAYGAAELAGQCGVSRRTVFRDLALLREAGLPLHFSAAEQVYSLPRGCFLPPTNFTHEEALALLLLCDELGRGQGLPFFDAAASASAKLGSSLSHVLTDAVRSARQPLRIRLGPGASIQRQRSVFDQLLAATSSRKCVRIQYDSLADGRQIQTRLAPYQLVFVRRSWYAIGRSSLHRAVRTFNLARVVRLEPLGDAFRVPRGFSIDRYLGNAWNLIREPGPDREVVLQFEPLVARNVAEIHWHKTQRLRWLPQGRLEFKVRVAGINEISWWVMGYGDQVRVVAPAALRKLVLQRAENMLRSDRQHARHLPVRK